MFNFKNKKNRGFTLVEMLVVIAIFLILTSIIMFNYRDFDDNIAFTNITYEVASIIREAQSYAINVSGYQGSSGLSFEGGYGVQFFTNPGGGPPVAEKRKNFIFFTDILINNDYNGICNNNLNDELCNSNNCGSIQECLNVLSLGRNIEIAKLCVLDDSEQEISFTKNPANKWNCGDSTSANNLAISFRRPEPEAIIRAYEGDILSGEVKFEGGNYTNYVKAGILLVSPRGAARSIHISSNGQIEVKFIKN